jgi:NAD(P)-dependent dehydrogenase (short-subunit alcohol dehydrogenase family)
MRLKGQVALVTGASRGVGKRIALQLAEEGATLVLAARTVKSGAGAYPGSIEETAAEVKKRGGDAMPVRCDLTVAEDTENLCRTALERLGRVDILVNNAFYNNPQHYDMFLDIDLETWNKCGPDGLQRQDGVLARFCARARLDGGADAVNFAPIHFMCHRRPKRRPPLIT